MKRFLKELIGAVPGRRNDTSLHRWRRRRNEHTSENGWSARPRGSLRARGDWEIEDRRNVDTDPLSDRQRVTVPRRVSQAAEGDAIAADEPVDSRGRRGLVLVRGMCDRIQREGEQQAGEGNSQPLRRSSSQMKDAHDYGWRKNLYRLRSARGAVKPTRNFAIGAIREANRQTTANNMRPSPSTPFS